jgi:hypothetical protein
MIRGIANREDAVMSQATIAHPEIKNLADLRQRLNGLPHATVDLSDQTVGLGAWTIDLQSADLAGVPPSLRSDGGADRIYRLKSDAVANMAFVCQDSVN